jgi:hypothetical protein
MSAKIIVFVCLGVLLSAAGFFVAFNGKYVGSFFSEEKARVFRLEKLIEKNSLNNLPFNIDNLKYDDLVEQFTKDDRGGNTFDIFRIMYKDSSAGNKIYSFVFDVNGICLLNSPENIILADDGLVDFSNDGKLEKIVCFNKNNSASANDSEYDSQIQVWRLVTPMPQLLLDVKYKSSFQPDEMCRPNIDYSAEGIAQGVGIFGRGFVPKVKFQWDNKEGKFAVAARKTEYWEVLFP